ncbi:biotin-dependent carboxyltransferase family protein [Bacillus sp. CGMCC 1.16541]|uniref:5-oxoprolinase subunit C family protein n=1 Tax=Bacillus sp. CGMCC 1.16541 TaxID=2185143 RepID=UPI000D72DEF7|nr:biotin-dependent carboxyltransferase family protein [Bacillus sp. CGMCC 1.16541]
MSLKIVRPGLLTTIQDLGRRGYQKEGIIESGPMDPFALRVGNLLVGNDEREGSLEITLMGPKIQFEDDHLIALTGGNLSPKLDGQPIKMWRPILVSKGSLLEFALPVEGCRTYMAVSGGLAVKEVMESKSTYLRAELGGLHGKALQPGDVIPCGEITDQAKPFLKELKQSRLQQAIWTLPPSLLPTYKDEPVIRVMKGLEYDLFTSESQHQFFEESFQITPQSDRMGYRLKGAELALLEPKEMLSSAVTFGTIQVPADGNPIVLLADHQTTGGYPRIAQVIQADYSKMGQTAPGKKVSFKEISLVEAEKLYIEQEKKINNIKWALRVKRGGE